mgnify:CR=1 FL=1
MVAQGSPPPSVREKLRGRIDEVLCDDGRHSDPLRLLL